MITRELYGQYRDREKDSDPKIVRELAHEIVELHVLLLRLIGPEEYERIFPPENRIVHQSRIDERKEEMSAKPKNFKTYPPVTGGNQSDSVTINVSDTANMIDPDLPEIPLLVEELYRTASHLQSAFMDLRNNLRPVLQATPDRPEIVFKDRESATPIGKQLEKLDNLILGVAQDIINTVEELGV